MPSTNHDKPKNKTGAMKAVAAFQEAQTKGKAIVLITDEV